MSPVSVVLAVVAAYLLGSIPTGYLVARARGVDIRSVGSGNIGATNVFRALGRSAGVLVLAVDLLKGLLAATLLVAGITHLYPSSYRGNPQAVEWLAIVTGVCAVLGHNYTCWLRFQGGKGIATSAGVLLALVPAGLGISAGVWGLVIALTRYVSLASITAAVSLPVTVWITGGSPTMLLVTGTLTVLALYKHRSNIRRLLNGTEHRIGYPSRTARL